jgi:two-component system, cell cycle response regulator DivK
MQAGGSTQRHFGAAAAPKRAQARAKPTILVAEDSADGREMMQMLLSLKGYDVILAENGPKALEVALTRFPDLILVDLQLPQLDGIGVTRNLRRHPRFKKIPIIVVSGHDPAKHRQSALDAGCNDYLLKPIDFEHLDEILKTSVPLIS